MPISNLHLASGIPIKNSLTALRPTFGPNQSWVPNTNRYVQNALGNITTDLAPGNSIVHNDMVDYIAASTVIHCFNSWSYLTSAISSFLEGDYGTAVHNAYYSELRSLMSFLAVQGVGIFSNKHIIVDASGTTHKAVVSGIVPSTHVVAKAAFDQWLKEQANTTLLLQSITVKDIPLENWLNQAGFSSLLAGKTSAQLLNNWSLDINLLENEHDLRNFVSYRPQNFDFGILRHSDNIRNRLETILGIWDMCEPSRFFELFILRRTLDDLNNARTAHPYSDEDDATVSKLVEELGLNPNGAQKYIVDFLKRRLKNTDNVLLNHARTFFVSNPVLEIETEPAGIISRACLLLLTVTNVVTNLIKSTGTNVSELMHWHNNLGIKLGYWEAGNSPEDFVDLWPEISDEIVEINAWLIGQGTIPSVFSFRRDLKQHSSNIRLLNKSYFWQI